MSTNPDEQRGIPVKARIVPPPTTISAAAQQFLSQPNDMLQPAPPPEDIAAWKAYISTADESMVELFKPLVAPFPATTTLHELSASTLFEIVPQSLDPALEGCAILYIHGGGFVIGGGESAHYAARPLAWQTGVRVFSPDYRLPPDHPFPAGLDDVVEAYRVMLTRYAPEKIAVCGVSAGGGLAGSFILKARDLGMPMPVAVVLQTPATDLTESGDTFQTNREIDVILKHGVPEAISLYAGGHDLRDPYVSPVFGDFSTGFPPTLLLSGTRDLLLSNTVLMHRALLKAGIEAELQLWEAMPHGGFLGAPEDEELAAEQVKFLKSWLGKA